MTCSNRRNLASFVIPFALATVSCADSVKITSIGVSRDPQDDCRETRHEFSFRVRSDQAVPQYQPDEWCGLLEEGQRLVCFLHSENGGSFEKMDGPKGLVQCEVLSAEKHEDWSCWEEERAGWLERDGDPIPNDGGSGG